jgi:hypothetical protein
VDSLSSEGVIPRRPNLFRALGGADPPSEIEVQGHRYHLTATLKHDSWAATAVYADKQGNRIACKFNRVSPLLIVPMAWLGGFLARREQRVFQLMNGVQGFPCWAGPVSFNGRVFTNVVAHHWIDGQPFKPSLRVNDRFFPTLETMIAKLHAHDIAYVDMSKWGNILVGDNGNPYLIDYQIYFRLPRGWRLRWWLAWLQGADLYYFHRHWIRARPDQVPASTRDVWMKQPFHVWIAESVGPAFRLARRLGLRLCGVRGDPRKQEDPNSQGISKPTSVAP